MKENVERRAVLAAIDGRAERAELERLSVTQSCKALVLYSDLQIDQMQFFSNFLFSCPLLYNLTLH